MSVSKWAYDPRKCDGHYCPGDCDVCELVDVEVDEYIAVGDSLDRFIEWTGDVIVRCRDCKHRHTSYCHMIAAVLDNDYCSYGIKK